jgi:SAM-dependent methyltransferase
MERQVEPPGSTPSYDPWRRSQRIVPVRPHLWGWLAPLVGEGEVLEIGPGLRPTAPVASSHFVDVSPHALAQLAERGGRVASVGDGLPFDHGYFGAVLAFEVLEHVEQDEDVMAEIARVLRPGGRFVMSVPIFQARWSPLDDACSHVRRYEPEQLFSTLRGLGLEPGGYFATSEGPAFLTRARARAMTADRQAAVAVMQRIAFPAQTAYQRTFGKVRWTAADVPVSRRAGDLTLWARRTG